MEYYEKYLPNMKNIIKANASLILKKHLKVVIFVQFAEVDLETKEQV